MERKKLLGNVNSERIGFQRSLIAGSSLCMVSLELNCHSLSSLIMRVAGLGYGVRQSLLLLLFSFSFFFYKGI